MMVWNALTRPTMDELSTQATTGVSKNCTNAWLGRGLFLGP